jgi:hypothetical protein
MLDIHRDIHSLTDFKRKTPEFLKQLRETGEPVVLTTPDPARVPDQRGARVS